MQNTYYKYIKTWFNSKKLHKTNLIILLFGLTNLISCQTLTTLFRRNPTPPAEVMNPEFLQAEQWVTLGEYQKAKPILIAETYKINQNYYKSLLLLTVIYDFEGQPEKALLSSKEILIKSTDPLIRMAAIGFYFKSQFKLYMDTATSPQAVAANLFIDRVSLNSLYKKEFEETLLSNAYDNSLLFQQIRILLEAKCQNFCLAEIEFLKFIQSPLIAKLEGHPALSSRIIDLIKTQYEFFDLELDSNAAPLQERKKWALSLFDALQDLNNHHLDKNDIGSIKVASLLLNLKTLQNKIERWLYDK